jgi:hypothetical protein
MEMHGSIARNLRLAVESSRRLRGHPVHRDTLQFWAELIREARAAHAAGHALGDPKVNASIAELEAMLAEHAAQAPRQIERR